MSLQQTRRVGSNLDACPQPWHLLETLKLQTHWAQIREAESASPYAVPIIVRAGRIRYSRSMNGADNLQIVNRTPVRKRKYWSPTYESSSDFVKPWWRDKYESEPPVEDHWVSILLSDREIARCKYVLTGADTHPVLGDLPHGQLDILAFEVAVPMRLNGIGRRTVQAIREQNPLPRMTALNDDAESRKFWDGIGWIRHESPNALLRCGERVTYSEP